MKSALTKFIVALTVAALGSNVAFTSVAKAQQWGTGMWGGMQGCGGNYGPAAGATSESDEVRQLKQDQADLKQEQLEIKKDVRELEREKERLAQAINDAIRPNWAGLFLSHMDGNRNCCISGGASDDQGEERPAPAPKPRRPRPAPSSSDNKQSSNDEPSNTSRMPAADMPDNVDPWATGGGGSFDTGGGGYAAGPQTMCYPPEDPYIRPAWNQLACPTGASSINPAVCSTPGVFQKPGIKSGEISSCTRAVSRYAKLVRELDKLEARKAAIANQLDDIKQALREAIRDSRMEANCPTCPVGGRVSGTAVRTSGGGFNWGSFLGQITPILAGAAIGGGLEYLNYQQNKANNVNLNKLGYATQPYQFGNYMYPFASMGIYGSALSGMNGGFGCAPGVGGGGFPYGPFGLAGPVGLSPYANMGGPFGYPPGMMPGFPGFGGGGMYNPGFGPWGAAGPWGNGAINPALFGGLGAGFPMAGGFPGLGGGFGGGFPGAGLPGAGFGGLPGFGLSAGFGFGQPGFGLPGTGGYPGLGFGGGFPGVGFGSPLAASPFGGMPGIGGIGSPYNSLTPFGSSPFGFNGLSSPFGGIGGLNSYNPYADAQRQYYNNMISRQVQGQQLYTRYYSLVNEINQFNSGIAALSSPGLGIPNYSGFGAGVGVGIGLGGGLNYSSGLSTPWITSAPSIYSPYGSTTGRSR